MNIRRTAFTQNDFSSILLCCIFLLLIWSCNDSGLQRVVGFAVCVQIGIPGLSKLLQNQEHAQVQVLLRIEFDLLPLKKLLFYWLASDCPIIFKFKKRNTFS